MGEKPKAGPDQAIGWMIAVACFFINFITAGLARSSGVMYVSLISVYGITREQATTPFSIRISVRSITGPLVGLLGQRYGIRGVATAGGIVAALGSILCYFAPNIFWITIFWGVIHGIGFGLGTVLHMMSVSYYFDKYRATALGFAFSGDSFGTFAFPLIIDNLISTYGVRGMFLVMGAILLNVVPLALLLKKPPWWKNTTGNEIVHQNVSKERELDYENKVNHGIGQVNKGFTNSEVSLNSVSSNKKTENINKLNLYNKEIETSKISEEAYKNNFSTDFKSSSETESKGVSGVNHQSDFDNLRTNIECLCTLPPVHEDSVLINVDTETTGIGKTDGANYEVESDNAPKEGEQKESKSRTSSFIEQVAYEFIDKIRSASFASQVAQECIVTNILQNCKTELKEECIIKDHHLERSTCNKNSESKSSLQSGNPESIPKQTAEPPCVNTNSSEHRNVFKMFVQTNLKPIFILICVTMAAFAYVLVGVLTVIMDYAIDNGVSLDKSKYLIIGYSFTDLIGRLIFGQVIDRKILSMKAYSSTTLFVSGVMVAVMPLYRSYNYLMACICFFGFIQGGTAIMFPILITLYMEKKEESIAMGCLNFYGGMLMLLMAPMIGYFRDKTGSYDGVFYVLGSAVMIVGLLWRLEPLLLRLQEQKLRKKLEPLSESTML